MIRSRTEDAPARPSPRGCRKCLNKINSDVSVNLTLFTCDQRRNLDINLAESQEWFPIWVWKRFEAEEAEELMVACEIEDQNREIAERMVKVALSCVQYRQESRPIMSVVVKMLEGSVEVPIPLNPFQHLIDGTFPTHPLSASHTNIDTSTGLGSSVVVTESSLAPATPIVTKLEIESAST
ncbi:G-type lectin S-receptor serine/threonine-protein kinase [Spatholobus suberectus]|nr:G-type lectin S-receptor serine/threonine-protein kinase [Spatholobus suberectus]